MLLDTSGGAAFAQFGSSVFLSDNADMLVVGMFHICLPYISFVCGPCVSDIFYVVHTAPAA